MAKLARLRFLPDPTRSEDTFVGDVLRRETVGGALALVAALVAVLWANSWWGDGYEALRAFEVGPLDVEHWAADGALTLFFFIAGLELKREFLVGSLSKPADAVVPVVAAMCGVAVPALIYTVVNLASDDGLVQGWAIPAATDIAFALAVLAVIATYLPPQLRAFLLTLAVVDDLIVILIIAAFYSSDLSLVALGLAVLFLAAYAVGQRLRIHTPLVLVPLAIGAWWFTHESGIHATIAGVALGMLTRVRPDEDESRSPAEKLEHTLMPVSAGVAVPFFALMSAGVVVEGGGALVSDPVVIGVVLGLVLGKPIGVFGGSWLLTKLTRAEIDEDVRWADVLGISMLAGIGFTVSLLVSDLSFEGDERDAAKTAVLVGSLISAVLATGVLIWRNRWHRARGTVAEYSDEPQGTGAGRADV